MHKYRYTMHRHCSGDNNCSNVVTWRDLPLFLPESCVRNPQWGHLWYRRDDTLQGFQGRVLPQPRTCRSFRVQRWSPVSAVRLCTRIYPIPRDLQVFTPRQNGCLEDSGAVGCTVSQGLNSQHRGCHDLRSACKSVQWRLTCSTPNDITVKIGVFCRVTWCSLVDMYRCFRETSCHHHLPW